MSYYSSHYQDGQEIHAGDIFLDGSEECQVTLVLERNEHLPDWRTWFDSMREMYPAGFMYKSRYGPIFNAEANEDQVLIRRG